MPFATDQILNLVDIERQATDPLQKGIAMSFVQHASAIDILPWQTLNTTKVRWLRRDGPFAKPKWTNPNAQAPKVKSGLKEQSETLYHMSADIDVDYRLLKDKNIQGNIRTEETDALIEGLGQMITNNFFWGDSTVAIDVDDLGNDVYEPDGMITRIRRGTAAGLDPSLRRNAAAQSIDLSPTGITAAYAQLLLRQGDAIAARMNKGKHQDGTKKVGGRLFLDLELWAALADTMRRAGGFAIAKDSYEREIETFHGFEIVIVGQKTYNLNQDDAASKILGYQDSSGNLNTSGNYMNMVFVRIGDDQVEGLQLEPLSTDDVGRVSGTRLLRTMLDWCIGYRTRSATCIGEIYGIKIR